MSEYIFQVVVVWTLLLTTISQAAIHFTTWWALGPQPPHDALAVEMRKREGALAAKHLSRSCFDVLLVFAVMRWGLPFGEFTRDGIYSATTVLALYALWRGVRFIQALRADNWGRPILESKDHRDKRQDLIRDQQTETGVIQAETTLINTSRGKVLSDAGVLLTEEQVRQEATRREQGRETARQDAVDVRQSAHEHELDVRDEEGG